MKKGFTIIELMAVIAIIAVLMAIVMTATANSIKLSRSQKASAIVHCVQQGIETYRAQKDEWPGPLGSSAEDGINSNDFGNKDLYELTAMQVRQTIRAIVDETVKGNPLIDISGLFVSRSPGENNQNDYGMDFWEAVRGSKRSPRKMSVSEMYFGYPETSTGHFRRLRIVYSIPTDSMEVKTQ